MTIDLPKTCYANSHGLTIAWQAIGQGKLDLVIAPGLISHVELWHDFPGYTRFLRRLSSFCRVITFDKRGQGLSDAIGGTPTLEERVDDLIAVMNAAGSKRAAILGFSEGGPMAFLLAATRPDLVSHIITFGAYGKAVSSPTYPHMFSKESRKRKLGKWLEDWGQGGGSALRILAPHYAEDPAMRHMFARIERYSSTPSAMEHYFDVNFSIDVLDILPAIRTPTLVLQRKDDLQVPEEAGLHLATAIETAKYVDAGTGGHLFWVGDIEKPLTAIEQFLTGVPGSSQNRERFLTTILFTDIVSSTEGTGKYGDDIWRDILDRHDSVCKEYVNANRGRLIKSTGDGMLALFDGPGRAVTCALQIANRVQDLGLSIRAGLHTGEIENRGDDISGTAVHIASRIEGLAKPNTVLISKTVVDLMAGNREIHFHSLGKHILKGFPEEWELFSVSF